jgi:hypothetical protein
MPEDLSYLFGEEGKKKKKGGKLKTVAMYGGAGLLAFLGGAALALMAMSPEQRNEAIEKLKGLLGSIGSGIAGAGRWAGDKLKSLWYLLTGKETPKAEQDRYVRHYLAMIQDLPASEAKDVINQLAQLVPERAGELPRIDEIMEIAKKELPGTPEELERYPMKAIESFLKSQFAEHTARRKQYLKAKGKK